MINQSIQHLIEPHVQDLGGFQARRLLPSNTGVIKSEIRMSKNG